MQTATHATTTEATYATVYYERGIEIAEIEGWVVQDGPFLRVLGDPAAPLRSQRHTMIPMARLVELDCIAIELP